MTTYEKSEATTLPSAVTNIRDPQDNVNISFAGQENTNKKFFSYKFNRQFTPHPKNLSDKAKDL